MSHTESVRIWNSFNLSTHWIHTNSNNNWQTFKSSRCQKLQTHLFGSFVQLTLSCTVFHYIILSISVHFVFVFSLRDLEWNWHALKRLGVTTLLEKWVSVVAGVCVCVCVMNSTSLLSGFQHVWNFSASAFKCSPCLRFGLLYHITTVAFQYFYSTYSRCVFCRTVHSRESGTQRLSGVWWLF